MQKKWTPKIFTFFEEILEDYLLIITWMGNDRFLSLKSALPEDYLFLWASKISGKLKVRTATHTTYSIVASARNLKIGLIFNLGSSKLKPATKPAVLTAASLLEIQDKEKLSKEAILSDTLIINIEEKPEWFSPIVPPLSTEKAREFVQEKYKKIGNIIRMEKEGEKKQQRTTIDAPLPFLSNLEEKIVTVLDRIRSSLDL